LAEAGSMAWRSKRDSTAEQDSLYVPLLVLRYRPHIQGLETDLKQLESSVLTRSKETHWANPNFCSMELWHIQVLLQLPNECNLLWQQQEINTKILWVTHVEGSTSLQSNTFLFKRNSQGLIKKTIALGPIKYICLFVWLFCSAGNRTQGLAHFQQALYFMNDMLGCL
jgi:hypothetical protein